MNVIQAFREIFAASRLKRDTVHAEENEFRYRRTAMLREKTAIQQLTEELKEQLLMMENSDPPIKAKLISVAPENVKYMSIARKGVRLIVDETPSLGVFRIEREEDVLS